jgi:hypothetical protein
LRTGLSPGPVDPAGDFISPDLPIVTRQCALLRA